MGRMIGGLRGRLVGIVLLIHAGLAPLLYIGLARVIQSGYEDLFIDDVRAQSRVLADELELAPADNFGRDARELLDAMLLSGRVVFADITDGGTTIVSSIPSAVSQESYPGDEFAFGDHRDQVYYLSHPLNRAGTSLRLRVGFDESPIWQQIRVAKRRLLAAVLLFTLCSVAAALWLSAIIARPMVRLQEAAERVARGDFAVTLQMRSSLAEVRELSEHLESMRSKLVGANEQLQREIEERQTLESQRLELERHILHRERIVTIGTLAGGIAHEFNNIMTPIVLYTQLMRRQMAPDAEFADELERVAKAAQRARSLVTRILTFSRDVRSQEEILPSLRPILNEALTLLRAIVPSNVTIVDRSSNDGTAIRGDPSLVHQVIMSLCTNAYQAMRVNGGVLSIDLDVAMHPTEPQLVRGRYTLLEVADTGHGMESSVMQRVFEPFFTTRPVGEGTGLGLSVVHGIVTSMGGTISVTSVVGAGSVFKVYIPEFVAEQEGAAATERAAAGSTDG